MTANELKAYFNSKFELGEWPKTFEVDAETYANCCQKILKQSEELNNIEIMRSGRGYLSLRKVYVGENNGLLFAGIELIYKAK